MPTPKSAVRIPTIALFILLIGCFVIYRSGYLTAASAETVSVAPDQSAIDTLPRKDSTVQVTIMSSSKMFILAPHRMPVRKKPLSDTLRRLKPSRKSAYHDLYIMVGSKYGRVLEPLDFNFFKFYDTSVKKIKQ